MESKDPERLSSIPRDPSIVPTAPRTSRKASNLTFPMKSAYELAMERLEKQSPSAKLTEAQKRLTDAQTHLTEAQAQTEERLNILVQTVQDILPRLPKQ